MDILIFKNCTPEDHEELIAALDKVFGKSKAKDASGAERAKRYRDKKRAEKNITENNVTERDENTKEEEKKEEEILPLVPSSLSSSPSDSPNNNPITPISPLPEEEKREEEISSAVIEEKAPFGLAQNVMLTGKEYEKLIEKLGYSNTLEMIDALSIYMAQNPKNARKYISHYYTILNWNRRNTKYIKPINDTPPEPEEDYLAGIDWEGKNE